MRNRLIACCVGLVLLGCAPLSTPAVTPVPSELGVHLLVAAQGQVSLSRAEWRAGAVVPARLGTELYSGDLLQLHNGAQATIVCADLTMRSARPGVDGIPCPNTLPMLRYGERRIGAVRTLEPTIPQIITPRHTKILDPRPTIRWRPVPGVLTYTVKINGTKWQTEVYDVTELVYPDDAPPLVEGTTYKAEVVAGDRRSDEEQLTGLGFELLDPIAVQSVRAGVTTIRGLNLSDEATQLLLARLYASNQLYAEAIAQLEGAPQTSRTLTIERLLGNWSLQIGLGNQARQHYQTVLDQVSQDDVETLAIVEHALARIALAEGDQAAAQRYLAAARAHYAWLGAQAALREVESLAEQVQ